MRAASRIGCFAVVFRRSPAMARALCVLAAGVLAAAELVPRPLTGAIVDAGLSAWQAAAGDLPCFEGYTEANSNRRLILPEPLEESILPGATVPVTVSGPPIRPVPSIRAPDCTVTDDVVARAMESTPEL